MEIDSVLEKPWLEHRIIPESDAVQAQGKRHSFLEVVDDDDDGLTAPNALTVSMGTATWSLPSI